MFTVFIKYREMAKLPDDSGLSVYVEKTKLLKLKKIIDLQNEYGGNLLDIKILHYVKE